MLHIKKAGDFNDLSSSEGIYSIHLIPLLGSIFICSSIVKSRNFSNLSRFLYMYKLYKINFIISFL